MEEPAVPAACAERSSRLDDRRMGAEAAICCRNCTQPTITAGHRPETAGTGPVPP
jgi:hypothetical protein